MESGGGERDRSGKKGDLFVCALSPFPSLLSAQIVPICSSLTVLPKCMTPLAALLLAAKVTGRGEKGFMSGKGSFAHLASQSLETIMKAIAVFTATFDFQPK